MLFNFGFILFPLTLIESERALAEFLGLNVTGTLGIRYNNQLVERLAVQIGEVD